MDPILIEYSCGSYLVWNKEEVITLREEFRIVGSLLCTDPGIRFQGDYSTLPLELMPEQVALLLDLKRGRLVQLKPPKLSIEDYKSYEDSQITAQSRIQHEQNIAQQLSFAEKILLGKKAKELKKAGLDHSKCSYTPEELEATKAEIRNIPQKEISSEDLFVETRLVDPFQNGAYEEIALDFPRNRKEEIQLEIFKDLWKKGHFISGGIKFGADYLVYYGDPTRFHAHYLAVCLGSEEELNPREIGSWTRVAHQVKKSVLLSTLSDAGQPAYLTIDWHKIA